MTSSLSSNIIIKYATRGIFLHMKCRNETLHRPKATVTKHEHVTDGVAKF